MRRRAVVMPFEAVHYPGGKLDGLSALDILNFLALSEMRSCLSSVHARWGGEADEGGPSLLHCRARQVRVPLG
jgi:hypothetical protein